VKSSPDSIDVERPLGGLGCGRAVRNAGFVEPYGHAWLVGEVLNALSSCVDLLEYASAPSSSCGAVAQCVIAAAARAATAVW
jgi:hypothetical protein